MRYHTILYCSGPVVSSFLFLRMLFLDQDAGVVVSDRIRTHKIATPAAYVTQAKPTLASVLSSLFKFLFRDYILLSSESLETNQFVI